MNENWKDVVGYEGLYQVSDQEHIRRLRRYHKVLHYRRFAEQDNIKLTLSKRGYYTLWLRDKNGRRKIHYAHIIVATAWVDNPENKPFVNHEDGIKTNIKPSNLKWATKAENNQHAYDTGLRGRVNNIPKIECHHCGLFIGTNMISRHIKAKHAI